MDSTLAIWVACGGMGLLFLARAFQNFIKPMFGDLSHGGFSYAQIAWLATAFVFPQSICAPLVGWYVDRTSIRFSLATCIVLGVFSFLLISTGPGFPLTFIAVVGAGVAFLLGKISLNTILVLHSSHDSLRRSVAKRATLLNLGSLLGNFLAQKAPVMGYSAYAILLGLFYLPLGLALAIRPSPGAVRKKTPFKTDHVKNLVKNRGFLADALRWFALTLPYGCWGVVISTYVIDIYGSNQPVWRNSITNLLTTLIGAHFLAVYVSAKLYRRGFKWEWWSMTSVLLYCTGMMLLVFAVHPIMLAVAVVIFTSGEVLMTPCFDETAKKHSGEESMSTCMGLLHLVDGMGRWLGMVFALAVYGYLRNSSYVGWFWPVVTACFFVVSGALHIACHYLGQGGDVPMWGSKPKPADFSRDMKSVT